LLVVVLNLIRHRLGVNGALRFLVLFIIAMTGGIQVLSRVDPPNISVFKRSVGSIFLLSASHRSAAYYLASLRLLSQS
jgi:hypothetical protein